MEERYKSLEKKTKDDEEDAAAAKAKEPKLSPSAKQEKVFKFSSEILVDFIFLTVVITLISLINVEVGINVEGVQKLPNH